MNVVRKFDWNVKNNIRLEYRLALGSIFLASRPTVLLKLLQDSNDLLSSDCRKRISSSWPIRFEYFPEQYFQHSLPTSAHLFISVTVLLTERCEMKDAEAKRRKEEYQGSAFTLKKKESCYYTSVANRTDMKTYLVFFFTRRECVIYTV